MGGQTGFNGANLLIILVLLGAAVVLHLRSRRGSKW